MVQSRILIIDDDPNILELYSRLLKKHGYDTVEAKDGNIGMKLYRENPTDLVITDVVMPEKEGIEVIRELRRDFADAKIIAISGGGLATSGTMCLQIADRLGASRTFYKPVSTTELLKAVQELLGK
jgi:DNA-binding response OmpR family regulator